MNLKFFPRPRRPDADVACFIYPHTLTYCPGVCGIELEATVCSYCRTAVADSINRSQSFFTTASSRRNKRNCSCRGTGTCLVCRKSKETVSAGTCISNLQNLRTPSIAVSCRPRRPDADVAPAWLQ